MFRPYVTEKKPRDFNIFYIRALKEILNVCSKRTNVH